MSEYMVEVGMQANVDGYLQSMGQAVAITKQYTQVADGMNGRLADLNSGIVGLTQRVTGFNKVNTVALDQAAAYQKALSGIETKATLSGKSFEALSKTTKTWAREFPIGLGRAVEVMTSLQQSGIKTEKQMGDLGKSFIKLGAATSTNAAAIGTEFLQLSRTMGNGISQFEKLSDSLVSTTAKIGGSAPSVVAFSKALAPVAATVGMSQTAVIGLSAAMSSLGEDGFQAANSLNKVMLDMNRAIRDGGPELKAYADLMGTTSSRLRDLWKTNPAEVIARFSEAVAKEGPNISRTLEALGFDSVRTTRSLTALARSGGPRQAMATAVAGYGDGSTAKAAEVAMEGVVDQAEKLQETMSQVVANVGQPMLGVAKVQLQIANQVSGLMAKATESDVGQGMLGAGGALSLAGGIAGNVMMAGGLLAMRRMMFGRNSGFGQGRAMARAGQPLAEDASWTQRAGFGSYGMLGGAGGDAGDLARREGLAGRMGRAANRLTSFGMQAAVKANDAINTNYVARSMGWAPWVTAAGQQSVESNKAAAKAGLDAARSGDWSEARAAARTAAADAKALTRAMSTAGVGRGAMDLMRSMSTAVVTNGALVGAEAMRAGGRLAGGMRSMGMTGPMVGITAAIAGGTYLSDQYGKQSEALGRVGSSSQDIYGAFNSFAEASGMAGKGLVSFQAQVEKTTASLVDQNSTMDKALRLSIEEISQATSPSYEAKGFTIAGDDKSPDAVAAQAMAVLGTKPRPQEVSRVLMDVVSQTNAATGEMVADRIGKAITPGKPAQVDYQALVDSLTTNKNDLLNFVNDAQGSIGQLASTAALQRAFEAEQVYGGKVKAGGQDIGAGQATALAEAKKIYEAAQRSPTTMNDDAQIATVNEILRSTLGFSEKQAIDAGIGADMFSDKALSQGKSFEEFMQQAYSLEQAPQQALNFRALRQQGFDFANLDYSRFKSVAPENEQESRRLQDSFNRVTGASVRLTDSLYGAEKAAREFATMPTMLTEGQRQGLSAESRLLQSFEANPTDANRLAAGQALSAQALRQSRNPIEAMFALALESAKAPEGYKKDAVDSASALTERSAGLYYSGGRAPQQALDVMQQGWRAQAMPASGIGSVNTSIQSQITMGMQAQGQANNEIASMIKAYGAMQAQIVSIRRSSGIAAGAVARDARLSEGYAREDYGLQRQYARQDYRTMRGRARRDIGIQEERATSSFGRQQGYAEEDYQRSRRYATADFNRQMAYQQADFDKTQLRAQEDFLTQKGRAQRDFDTSMMRASRDYVKSQSRAEEDFALQQTRSVADYNRGRLRMTEDYNKQMRRLVEDSTKSLMDPYKRIAAQMVMDAGQLVANLQDQADAMQQQVSNLAEARGMGLSDQAIKQLSLSDAGNAQQLSRILEDMRQNGDLVGQLNAAVSARSDAGASLVTDAGNTSMQRAAEDFATTMARNEEDFATSLDRATADFATSKARASDDFRTSLADAQVDFGRSMADMDADFGKSMARAFDDFGVQVARSNEQFGIEMERMAEQYQTQRKRASEEFRISMQQMWEDFYKQMRDAEKDFNRSQDRAETAFENSIERMRTRAENAIADIGAQAAAQIKSMEESFVGMFQQAPKDAVDAAKRAREILASLGIDKDLWGDEMTAIWDAATAILNRHIMGSAGMFSDARETYWAGRDKQASASSQMGQHGFSDARDTAQGRKSPIEELMTASGNQLGPAFRRAGEAVADGFRDGFVSRIGNPAGFLFAPLQGIIDAVKKLFGIESPSKVFKKIGEDVVDGFHLGIAGKISDAWKAITDPIADLDVKGKVEAVIDKAQAFVKGLDIGGWLDWGKLTSAIPSPATVADDVKGAFATAKAWLAGLSGDGTESIKGWMAGFGKALTGAFPTTDQVLAAIKAPFTGDGGVLSWLSVLDEELKRGMPAADDFAKVFDSLKAGMKSAFSDIVEMWNKLDVSPTFRSDRQTVGAFNFNGWSIRDFLGEERQILPPAYFPGITIPSFSFTLPDLVPNIPNRFAEGGIATRQTSALIAEAGYPEAVIPLNKRGAEVLAATMARYVDGISARNALVQPYATSVVNHYTSTTQDYSTQFNGQITVQAQDPDAMTRKLQARARRQALAQPVRGRA